MKRIVFIPGIMGSELYEGRKFFGETRRWFSFSDKTVKRLKLEPGKDRTIIPGGPLEYGYKLVGNAFSANVIYAPMLKMLESFNSSAIQFHPYGYDWRKDLWDTCVDFHRFLSLFKNDDIYIVAHSMGGLLAHTYCQWAKDRNELPNIKKIITIGTPWKGSPDAFKVLKYGIKDKGWFFPNYDTITNISRTFPSIYQLLPSSTYCRHNRYIVEPGRALRWLDCMNYIQAMDGCNVASIAQLNTKLHNSLQKPWPNSIDHYNIIGVDQGSVGTITLNPNGHDGMQQPVDGDGVVPLESAVPYNLHNNKGIFYAKASHQGLAYHEPVLQWIENVLRTGSPIPIGGIYLTYSERRNWTMEKIDCPVEVVIEGEEKNIDIPKEDITRHNIGEATYLIHNSSKPTTIAVEAYDDGRTSIETIRVADNKITSITKFPSIEADPARRAIINVDFKDDESLTKVYIPSEEDEMKPNEVIGITVPVPEKIIFNPPSTQLHLSPVNQGQNMHFDEQGVNLRFNVDKNSEAQYLETLYRINEGNWQSYSDIAKLTLDSGLNYGKNILEFYSKDVYDNEEQKKKKVFYIEPSYPKTMYKVELHPDSGITLKINEFYPGVKAYTIYYKTSENGEEYKYVKPLKFPAGKKNEVYIKAVDIFDRESNWEKLNLDFNKLTEVIWDTNGFQGTISDIVELLGQNNDDLVSSYLGRKEKDSTEKIPKTARNLYLKFNDCEYTITFLPKLEIYLRYHSQIIMRSDKEVQISFLVYDTDGNAIKDLNPSVKCTLISNTSKKEIPKVKVSNNKGVYTFTISVEKIPQEVQKIKFEFRDTISRAKPIETQTFKLE
ncbi:alpha/beta fold hydrolase [Priestia megaterium]